MPDCKSGGPRFEFQLGIIFSLKFLLMRKWTKWWTTTTQVIPWSLDDGRRQKCSPTQPLFWSWTCPMPAQHQLCWIVALPFSAAVLQPVSVSDHLLWDLRSRIQVELLGSYCSTTLFSQQHCETFWLNLYDKTFLLVYWCYFFYYPYQIRAPIRN